jgi:two-component system chemotaxis response regulator CheY
MAKKIMIVDDSLTVRQQVGTALGEAGYEVVEAVDGVDAMEKFAAFPDLAMLICDINMPRMNGLDLLARLKEQGGIAIPILMLTTEGQPSPIERAKQLGAKGWLVKPIKADMLLATVRKVIGE